MPTFQDSESRIPFVPEGDYKFTVIDFDSKIATGATTRGSTQYELKLEIAAKEGHVHTYENLIDHPKTLWKMDTFLKCSGIKLAKGEGYDFRKDVAEESGVRWINPLGLRGWCRLTIEEYQNKKRNKVSVFYIDKEKLPQVEIIVEEAPEEDKPF